MGHHGAALGHQVDVGVAQVDAVGDRRAVAQHAPVGQPAELVACVDIIPPGQLAAALERVQVDADPKRRGRLSDGIEQLVGRPLRCRDRQLHADHLVASQAAGAAR